MKKQIAISITIATMITLNSMVYAVDRGALENLKNKAQIEYAEQRIQEYLESGWDFLGWKGEKLYFEMREDYAEASIIKQVEFDIKTTSKQFRAIEKNYKDNDLIYDSFFLVGFGGKALVKYFKVGKIAHAKNKVKVAKDFAKVKITIIKKMMDTIK